MATYITTTYTDILDNTWVINLIDDTYTGPANVVNGSCTIEYPDIEITDVVRGSQCNIQLEQSPTDTWQQRLIDTVGDKKISVTVDKNGTRFWNGFFKADGIIRNYVQDRWITTITAVDGLGLLENIAFLDSDGNEYTGQQKELDLVLRCLELTGLDINVRLFIFNLYFTVSSAVPVFTNEALRNTYVNAERFQKTDQEKTVFTAKEVLEACLKKYGAFVCQYDNRFNVIRIRDFYNDETTQQYIDYQIDGTQLTDGFVDLRHTLGSQIDGFNPHHAQANQQIEYNAALGAYKVIYTYGFVKSILLNPTLIWDTATNIDQWTYTDINDFDIDLQDDGTYRAFILSNVFIPDPFNPIEDYLETALTSDISTANEVSSTELLEIEINGLATHKSARYLFYVQIVLETETSVTYYLNTNGEWTLSNAVIKCFESTNDIPYDLTSYDLPKTFNFTTKINANTIVEDGNIQVILYKGIYDTGFQNSETLSKVDVTNVAVRGAQGNFTGESYTSKRITNAVSIVDLEDKVFSGDNASDIYVGAIEDVNENNTLLWAKDTPGSGGIDSDNQFPLLDWLSKDRLTISGGNSTIFTGSVFGEMPYLGQLTINNNTGIFMTTSYVYDTRNALIDAKHIRIFNDDISEDILTEFNYEDATVIKPAIE